MAGLTPLLDYISQNYLPAPESAPTFKTKPSITQDGDNATINVGESNDPPSENYGNLTFKIGWFVVAKGKESNSKSLRDNKESVSISEMNPTPDSGDDDYLKSTVYAYWSLKPELNSVVESEWVVATP